MRTIFYLSVLFTGIIIFIGYHPDYISGIGSSGNPLTLGSEDQIFRQRLITYIGGAFVFLFYFFKFDQWTGTQKAPPGFNPKPTRHFTTWLRYIGWAGIYGSFMVVCYGLLVIFPTFFINLFSAYEQASSVQIGFFSSMLSSLEKDPSTFVPYAVILLTVFWSGTFSDKEEALRQNLQEHALIPIEATRLINYYWAHIDRFKPNPIMLDDVLEDIPDSLISNKPELIGEKGSMEQWFIQCEYLMYQITQFKENRLLIRSLKRYEEDISGVESKLSALRVQLQNYKMEMLDSMRTSSEMDNHERLDLPGLRQVWNTSDKRQTFEKRYFKNTGAQIQETIGECLRTTLGIVVCIVLANGKSHDERQNLLTRFGLCPPEYCSPMFKREDASRVVIGIGITVVLCSIVYYVIDNKFKGTPVPLNFHPVVPALKNTKEIIEWSLYGVFMHLLGVMGGYFVQRWQSEQRRLMGNRDSGRFIFSDYLLCGIFGFCLNVFLFSFLLLPSGRWDDFETAWLWSIIPSASAMFTGFYMTRKKKLPKGICLVTMVSQGLVTSLFSAAVLFFLYYDVVAGLTVVYPALWAFCVYTISTAFFTGIATSYVLLCWIQRQNSERQGSIHTSVDAVNLAGGEL